MEDNYVQIKVIGDSPYVLKYKDRIKILEELFNLLRNVLPDLQTIQRKYLYMEPIMNKSSFENFRLQFKKFEEILKTIYFPINKCQLVH